LIIIISIKEVLTLSKVIDAIYENGVLKPLEDLNLPEHEKVKISISIAKDKLNILEHLKNPPKILPIEEIVKAEVIDAD